MPEPSPDHTPTPTTADDGKHGGSPAPIKPWTPPPTPPSPDGNGRKTR